MSGASKLLIVAALAVSASGIVSKVAAQQGGPQAATARYQAIHTCMLRAHQQYPSEGQGDDRMFAYSSCMTSAGFQP
jgi:hypothetical protein